MSRSITALTRRQAFTAFLAATAAYGDEPVSIPGKKPLLLHNDRPEDLETPSEHFGTWLTPTDAFFVRQHIPRPKVDAESYRLTVNGRVAKSLNLTLADLRKLPQVEVPATLECAGNGRGFFRPRVPGLQWMRGAIGNAAWRGPRLSEVLKLAGVDANAPFVEFDGADQGIGNTPDFVRSLPMKKMVHPATIVALQMNGETLPDIHGFPCRLIVPGWDGASWVKWLQRITVADKQNTGFFMNPAYRFPKYNVAPGAPAKPEELEMIEGMAVKSSIMNPRDQAKAGAGPIEISGIAWAGEEKIESVDVSTDGGSHWKAAELSRQNLPFAWRLWKFSWKPPKPGYYTVVSRATDSAGRVQPFEAVWNPSGYAWNAMDRIGIVVEHV
ncbi:MAG: sulfite oxidase [Acidobacteriota bacterium]|nr:sulfite oxidase [Acidobacteriota bacterium]